MLEFIEHILSERGLNTEKLAKPAGKLSHFPHKVFNRSGRAFMYPLYNHSGHFRNVSVNVSSGSTSISSFLKVGNLTFPLYRLKKKFWYILMQKKVPVMTMA
jgi:hypothetical protein